MWCRQHGRSREVVRGLNEFLELHDVVVLPFVANFPFVGLDMWVDNACQASITRLHDAIRPDIELLPISTLKPEEVNDAGGAVHARATGLHRRTMTCLVGSTFDAQELIGRFSKASLLEQVHRGNGRSRRHERCVAHVKSLPEHRRCVKDYFVPYFKALYHHQLTGQVHRVQEAGRYYYPSQ